MKIGVAAFLTEKSGNPGTIAAAAEHAVFESFWVAEHLVIPAAYTTHYQRSPDGKVPEFYAHLADPFVALAAAAQAGYLRSEDVNGFQQEGFGRMDMTVGGGRRCSAAFNRPGSGRPSPVISPSSRVRRSLCSGS